MIEYEQLSQMKPLALQVNTGQGVIVFEADLARALDEELIAVGAIDVFEIKPIKPDNLLL